MGDASESDDSSVLSRVFATQRDRRQRGALTAGSLVVGVALATVHWSGLLVGGALVGLVQPTLRRAILAGLGYGFLVVVAAAARFTQAGTLAGVLGTWPLVALFFVVPVVVGPIGATVRGLFADAPENEP